MDSSTDTAVIIPQTCTPEEIAKLKMDWWRDPCWDIETTEDFEAHKEELLQYRIEQEAIWTQWAQEALQQFANKIGCPDNLVLAEYVRGLENRLARLEKGEE